MVAGSFLYTLRCTEFPAPFSSKGTFPDSTAPGLGQVDWYQPYQTQQVIYRDHYSGHDLEVGAATPYNEDGNPAKVTQTWTNDTSLVIVTSFYFKVPNVLAHVLQDERARLITIGVEVVAHWPERAGVGSFTNLVVSFGSMFLHSQVSRPAIGSSGLAYRFTMVGLVHVVKAFADFFTLQVTWGSKPWTEGTDSYGFDITYNVTTVDFQVKLGGSVSELGTLMDRLTITEIESDEQLSLQSSDWSVCSQ